MRSAAVVMAAEYVAAGGAGGRSVVARALQRADEPAEMIGYWIVNARPQRPDAGQARRRRRGAAALHRARRAPLRRPHAPDPHGRRDRARAPVAARRGAVGAVQVPAGPSAPRRRGRGPGGAADARRRGRARRVAGRRAPRHCSGSVARRRSPRPGISWERLSGWLPGGMDAEAWEAVIPSMGVMALVRNLRNFDQAGIARGGDRRRHRRRSRTRIEVAAARLFPYQVWAAYQHAPSDNWKRAARSHARPHGGRTSPRSTARSS